MERLVASQLAEELPEDELAQARYGFQDLLHLFAREEADQERPAALTRGLPPIWPPGSGQIRSSLPKAAASPGASLPSDISDEVLQDLIRWV